MRHGVKEDREGLVDLEELIFATDYDCDLDDSFENFSINNKLLSRCKRYEYHKHFWT